MIGDLLALASATCFAVSNITIARGARAVGEDNGAFLSLLVTLVISSAGWLLLGSLRGFEPVTARALLWFAAAGVATMFVGRVFFYASVQRLGAMRSSTLKRLNPFFTVLLGVLVLGETLTPGMVAGMALIVASFAVLVAGARGPAVSKADGTPGRRLLNAGYIYGPLSALGYAVGALLRKLGLTEAHDVLLGAAVGCLAGALLFVATAAFREEYARAVRATFAERPRAWLLAAGVMSSLGQILFFAALDESPISRVALIGSIEVFITLALGAWLLHKRETLTPAVVLAAVLGVGGTALIIGL